ncbi:MAG: carbohydrate kinase [Pedosphaera sp.]|nr:carbohydrate kinase [Pedosphaera sp.]
MNSDRLHAIATRYASLRVALVGDFCLDRYLEIDPARAEISIETGLAVHNIVSVRSQPGGAGTILNNLAALGVGEIWPVGFYGEDGEGYELRRALKAISGARLDHFIETPARRTFTYCKPLVLESGQSPRELNRLDSKNWTPTPETVSARLVAAVRALGDSVDAIILLDQVDVVATGVVTAGVLNEISALTKRRPELLILADSRRGLRDFPQIVYKMNRAELAALTGADAAADVAGVKAAVARLARKTGQRVFVTLSEEGIIGADASGAVEHVPSRPVRGKIDIVGAGDAVTANLAATLAAGAELREAMEIAMAAASSVVHQIGTTGTASVAQLHGMLIR